MAPGDHPRDSSSPKYLLYYLSKTTSGETAISSLIIDGYNLIGIQHRDLQKQRERLILQLAAYKKRKGHDITVVFDGWKSGGHNQEQTITGGVCVIYSRLGDKADEVIKDIMGQGGKEWIVISSDREIADHAWRSGSVPVPSDQFSSLLEHAGNNFSSNDNEQEEDFEQKLKGSPRQRSRKEKALIRVLNRL
ncbi:MAG: NYN domain-containing protein [Nitrospirae bacterium]|nr:NYN domain-containing protein [Nitrospirota bacterium]